MVGWDACDVERALISRSSPRHADHLLLDQLDGIAVRVGDPGRAEAAILEIMRRFQLAHPDAGGGWERKCYFDGISQT